jgi:hypothetical protein
LCAAKRLVVLEKMIVKWAQRLASLKKQCVQRKN